MKNNIVVIFSSHLSEEENQKFIKHINNTIGGVKHKVVCYPNFNQFSLSQIYNEAIKNHIEKDCIFLMCHNDITIKTKNWGKILLNQFNYSDYSIIGIAGSTFIPASGRWWDDRSKMYGIVEHTNGLSTWASEYSNQFNRVKPTINIDGLFMSFDPNSIAKGFNENYGKYHFYDVIFSVENYLEDINIGVITSIRVLHQSVGETDLDWETNRQKFVEEFNLPIRHVSEDKLRVLICCQFFKNYTGSELVVYEYSKELVKLGCDVSIISSMIGDPLLSKAQKNGVKVYGFSNLPNHRLNDKGQFEFFKNEKEFDIIHINHKPIGELILQLYPNTPAVMHIHSEIIPKFEEPIINNFIKKYISIRPSVTEYIKTFNILSKDIVEIDNPFDCTRFNTNYKSIKNEKEIILFIGTLDYLRKDTLFDLCKITNKNSQEFWIIGADNMGYAEELEQFKHVKWLGVKSNVEDYLKKCDYTAGILVGRTTIEGFLCGKKGWVYDVDGNGKILNKKLMDIPVELNKYSNKYVSEKVLELYNNILDL